MNDSVAIPVIEYRVETLCGRIFSWSATRPESLFYEFKRDTGLTIGLAEPWAVWEAREASEDGYKQLELNSELEGVSV